MKSGGKNHKWMRLELNFIFLTPKAPMLYRSAKTPINNPTY